MATVSGNPTPGRGIEETLRERWLDGRDIILWTKKI